MLYVVKHTLWWRWGRVGKTPSLYSSTCLAPSWYVSPTWSICPLCCLLCRWPWPDPNLWRGWERWHDLWLLTCSVHRLLICQCFVCMPWYHVERLLVDVPEVVLQMLGLSHQCKSCCNSYTVSCRHIHRYLVVCTCLLDAQPDYVSTGMVSWL